MDKRLNEGDKMKMNVRRNCIKTEVFGGDAGENEDVVVFDGYCEDAVIVVVVQLLLLLW